jgi:hypothetical protein
MPFSDLTTNTISILKKDGTRIDSVKAAVSKDNIAIFRNDIIVESGDLVQHDLSNGTTVTYRVIDPGFHESFHSIPAGYSMEVRKLGLPEAEQAVRSIVYNVHGSNARLNYKSVDNSTNTININSSIIDQITLLRSTIANSSLSDEEKKAAHELVDATEQQISSVRPSKTVVSALLGSLPKVESITNIASNIADLFNNV